MTRLRLRFIKVLFLLFFEMAAGYCAMAASITGKNEAAQNVKQQILSLAESYKGLGDPDFPNSERLKLSSRS